MKIPLLRWYIFPSAFLIVGYILYVIVIWSSYVLEIHSQIF